MSYSRHQNSSYILSKLSKIFLKMSNLREHLEEAYAQVDKKLHDDDDGSQKWIRRDVIIKLGLICLEHKRKKLFAFILSNIFGS